MPRSRSRSGEIRSRRDRDRNRDRDIERSKDRHRDKKSRSKSRERRRNSRDRDHKRRERDRSSERQRREKPESSRRRSLSKSHGDRHRDKSPHEKSRDKRRDSRDRRRDRSSSRTKKRRSESGEKKTLHNSTVKSSNSVHTIIIAANTSQKSNKHKSSENEQNAHRTGLDDDHRDSFEISNEFSREGFEQFSRDHGIDFTNIDTEEDREAIHEKMEELLKEHFAAQGKIYPPPPKPEKPSVNAATGFANDGSFLEQFKKMHDEYQQQQQNEQKRQFSADSLSNLPVRRRRGGKILKTGVVAKTKLNNQERSVAEVPSNAWGIYIKEVQKYKSSSCDSESKTRPLVK